MAIFDFKTQRMHTQLHGSTSGREMFKVEEYNQRKKSTAAIVFLDALLITLLYFCWNFIPGKFLGWLMIVSVGMNLYGWFNYKQQIRLRENLY